VKAIPFWNASNGTSVGVGDGTGVSVRVGGEVGGTVSVAGGGAAVSVGLDGSLGDL